MAASGSAIVDDMTEHEHAGGHPDQDEIRHCGGAGLSHSFRWRELRRWSRRCRLPSILFEQRPQIRRGRAGEHRLPRLWAHYKFRDIGSSEIRIFRRLPGALIAMQTACP